MTNKNPFKLGITQGRLTPFNSLEDFPKVNWKNEFYLANKLGFDYIEYLVDRKLTNKNPIWNSEGLNQILDVIKDSKISVYSLKADFIINHSLIEDNYVLDKLNYLIEAASYLNAKLIILPLFEASCLDQKSYNTLFKKITYLSKIALKNNINLIIECSLSVKKLINFLSSFLNKNVYHVFDTGNNYLLNKSKYQEVVSLGNFIQHIHIKDKNTHNQNVFLGTGSVNFNDFFLALKKINYKGVFIFETPIGKTPQNTALYNKCFCNFFINEIMLDN